MIRIGYLLHKTPSGRLLIKLTIKRPPKLGSKVVNSSRKTVGKVVDIIGNVSSPYVIAKPTSTDLALNQYSELFIKTRSRREKK